MNLIDHAKQVGQSNLVKAKDTTNRGQYNNKFNSVQEATYILYIQMYYKS